MKQGPFQEHVSFSQSLTGWMIGLYSASKGSNVTFALYTGDFVRHSIQRMPDPKQNVTRRYS